MKKIALLLAVLLAVMTCVPAFTEGDSVSVAIVYADTVDDTAIKKDRKCSLFNGFLS